MNNIFHWRLLFSVDSYDGGGAVNSVPAIGVLVYYLLTLTVTLLSESSQSKTQWLLNKLLTVWFLVLSVIVLQSFRFLLLIHL